MKRFYVKKFKVYGIANTWPPCIESSHERFGVVDRIQRKLYLCFPNVRAGGYSFSSNPRINMESSGKYRLISCNEDAARAAAETMNALYENLKCPEIIEFSTTTVYSVNDAKGLSVIKCEWLKK